MQQRPFLIMAPTGKTGRRLCDLFESADIDYRGASRSSTVPFDWLDRQTWPTALNGVGAAYVLIPPELAFADSISMLTDFLEECERQQIEQLTLLAGRGEEVAQKSEELFLKSSISSTIVRASWFNQNFSESLFTEDIVKGELIVPEISVSEPFIDTDDIAEVLFSTLTCPDYANKILELTGPELLNFADIAAQFSEVLDRPVKHTSVPLSDYLDAMRASGCSCEDVQMAEFLYGELLDGRNAYLTNDFQQVIGRSPKSFKQFITETKPSGVWNT